METTQAAHVNLSEFTWFCPPALSEVVKEEGAITVKTLGSSDFWRKTHYGFIRDNGHFLHLKEPIKSNFEASVAFSGKYQDLYDQAGLMIRKDEITWMKCGIEYVHGVHQASTVITNDFSDWSVTPLKEAPDWFHLKVVWKAPALEVFYSLDGKEWTMMRLGYLLGTEATGGVLLGLMTCSPDG